MWLWAMDYLLLGVGLISSAFAAYDCRDAFPRWWAHLGVFTGCLSCLIFVLFMFRLAK